MLFIMLIVYTFLCVNNDTPADPYTVAWKNHVYKLYNIVEKWKDTKEIGVFYTIDETDENTLFTDLWWSIKVDGKINFKRLIKAVSHVCKEAKNNFEEDSL